MPKVTYSPGPTGFGGYIDKNLNDCGIRRAPVVRCLFLADGVPAFLVVRNFVVMIIRKFEKPITDLATTYEKEKDTVVEIVCTYQKES